MRGGGSKGARLKHEAGEEGAVSRGKVNRAVRWHAGRGYALLRGRKRKATDGEDNVVGWPGRRGREMNMRR